MVILYMDFRKAFDMVQKVRAQRIQDVLSNWQIVTRRYTVVRDGSLTGVLFPVVCDRNPLGTSLFITDLRHSSLAIRGQRRICYNVKKAIKKAKIYILV